MTRLATRAAPPRAAWALEQTGVHPLLARLYASRGISDASQLDTRSAKLLAPELMKNTGTGAVMLADAIAAKQNLLIVADYDCDGATACAVGLRALRMMGARVDYLVPDRFTLGYGLSPEVVQLAVNNPELGRPDIIITVDNGIASVDGVNEATRLGIRTLITDHHLPGDALPAADVIVNPNQTGCEFPSKCIAGVGVMFYLMLALRAELRRRGVFSQAPEPNLAGLLDLVALGTIADVVALDYNNRILVTQGLNRMRAGHMQAGIAALFRITGREPRLAATFDLGFMLGPRLNAAGRLADMSLGIEALITDDMARALNIAQELDKKNRERRAIESEMKDDAELLLNAIDVGNRASLTLFDAAWHQGVVGILAGRVKEKFHRPTFAFARGNDGELKASGRSIPGLHLRDALDLVAKRQPSLLIRFGGHAAAAGLTLLESRLSEFEAGFEQVCRELIHPAQLTRTLETDGPLELGYYSVATARMVQQEIWGQAFPPPVFDDTFQVIAQKILKEKHLKLKLKKGDRSFEAIQFNCADTAPPTIRAAFRLDLNEWNGTESVQLMLEHFEGV